MRLVLIANFPPKNSPEADHAFHLSEHLAERGLEVHVVTTRGSTPARHPRVVVHPIMRRWSWTELPKLVFFLKRCSPSAILLVYVFGCYHGQSMITFLPTVARTALPRSRFVTLFEDATGISPFVQTTAWDPGLVPRALRKATLCLAGPANVDPLYGTLLRDSHRLIVVSDRVGQVLATRYPGAEGKSAVIPVPPIVFMCPEDSGAVRRQKRQALGIGPENLLVAYFGYIYPTKGVETLLTAFSQVNQRQKLAKCVLVGGSISFPGRPNYLEELREMVKVLGLEDQVFWTGAFAWDSDEGSRYLRAADLCVLPFETGVCVHNSSLAVACAHGLPIITTRGETLEPPFIHGESVFLCPPKNPEALARAMEKVMESAGLRDRLSAGARRLAQECYSWDDATDRTLARLGLCGAEGNGRPARASGAPIRPRIDREAEANRSGVGGMPTGSPIL